MFIISSSHTLKYLIQLLTLIIIFYLLLEAYAVTITTILTSRKYDERYVILAPVMVVFYRPLYLLVRLWAYISTVLGMKAYW